jgi:hypothetical protein
METASRRQSATTRVRVRGSIGSAEIFAEGTAYTTTKWDVHHAVDWADTGRAWWAADGAWSACGRVERAAVQPTPRGTQHTRYKQLYTYMNICGYKAYPHSRSRLINLCQSDLHKTHPTILV